MSTGSLKNLLNLPQRCIGALVLGTLACSVAVGPTLNGVGVFNSVGFSTRLTLHDGKGIETLVGSSSFITSLEVMGNHVTHHTRTCCRL